jgi:murein DD-endopeptidase MepM/ murein hydrolase activator NlpD
MFSVRSASHSGESEAVARATRPVRHRAIAVAIAFAFAVTGSIATAQSASAVSYPSWGDVQAAQANQATKAAAVAQINSVITQLNAQVATAQADAAAKGEQLQVAQQHFDEAAAKLGVLKAQAEAAKAKAKASRDSAGAMAAQMARSGDSQLVSSLFFNGSSAKDLLNQLSLASKVTDQSQGVYDKALQEQNVAGELTKQSDLATTALAALNKTAQDALATAQAASEAASAALADQAVHKNELDAQLAALVSNTQMTQASYNAGVAVAAQQAAAAKAAAAAAAAASAPSAPASTPSAPSGGGSAASTGWVRPSGGHISSPYGWRVDPYTHIESLHPGTDFGQTCGNPIWAAHSGKVIYAGAYGGYGNFVQIANNDGTGISTAYGHIVDGGILVSIGQQVSAGQQIARVGSTGWSTGCHLHFEIRLNNATQDPVPFMRARGVELAN